jgi:hypothetical protein
MLAELGRMLLCAFLISVEAFNASPAFARALASQVTELDRMPELPGHFPVPNDPNMLFYVQRSTNANTIVYAADMAGPRTLNADKPINVYWRRFAEDGRQRALYFFERILAFGARVASVPGEKERFQAHISGYPERSFTVDLDRAGRPEAVAELGTHRVHLVAAYIELAETGFIPTLISADIFGIDESSGRVVREHLAPGKD